MKPVIILSLGIMLSCAYSDKAAAQETDKLCDSWFSQERFECPKNYIGPVQVPCIPPVQFEPNCVKQDVNTLQEYLLDVYETVDMYSGMFNDMVKDALIEAAVDFYNAARSSSDHFYESIREGNYAEAAATLIDDITPGDFREDMARAEEFYSAVDEGDYEKAVRMIVEDTVVEAIRSGANIPTDVQTLSENARKFYDALKNGDYEQAAVIAANDLPRIGDNSQQARKFYGALRSGDYQKAVITAGGDLISGAGSATYSDYYLKPFTSPAADIHQLLATTSDGKPDALYYKPSYRDIIGTVRPAP